MKNDKLYRALIGLYEEVYKSIGEDFHSIDKVDGWFKNYFIDSDKETKIVNNFLSRQKLTKPQKNIVSINYYLGCSPMRKK